MQADTHPHPKHCLGVALAGGKAVMDVALLEESIVDAPHPCFIINYMVV